MIRDIGFMFTSGTPLTFPHGVIVTAYFKNLVRHVRGIELLTFLLLSAGVRLGQLTGFSAFITRILIPFKYINIQTACKFIEYNALFYVINEPLYVY